MFFLSLTFPFFGVILTGFFGRFFGFKGVKFFSIFLNFFSLVFSGLVFYETVSFNLVVYKPLFEFFSVSNFLVFWALQQDSLITSMLFMISFISFLVQIYSCEYMSQDPHFIRFIFFLFLFTFFMNLLVSSSNLLQFFVGWEGVGVCSYLLVGFWFTRTQANTSSVKAFLVNRVGDFGFFLGLTLIGLSYKTFEFILLGQLIPKFQDPAPFIMFFGLDFQTILSFLFFFGVMSKSAQIFLHSWLPDAMEGPTPVSALIHAATMVAAGIFLLVKFNFQFFLSVKFQTFCIFIGSVSAFLFSLIGFFQNDIKKVVAYSTCSQLGYMVAAAGAFAVYASYFHLVNHAFFKALLFLTSGVIIHALNDNQDIRRMGSVVLILPFSYVCFCVGSISLAGLPPFSGFYSKDLIIELVSLTDNLIAPFCGFLLCFAAMFTAAYSFKLIFLIFFNQINIPRAVFFSASENVIYFIFPLFSLSFFSIFFGFFSKDFFMPESFSFALAGLTVPNFSFDHEFFGYLFKLKPLFFSYLGLWLAIYLCIIRGELILPLRKFKLFYRFFNFFSKKMYFDVIVNFYVSTSLFNASKKFQKIFESDVFEKFGPAGLITLTNYFSRVPIWIQSGIISLFLLYIVLSIYFFLFISFFLPIVGVSVIKPFAIVFTSLLFYNFGLEKKFFNENTIPSIPRIYFIRFFKKIGKYIVGRSKWVIIYLALISSLSYYSNSLLIWGYFYYRKYGEIPIKWFIDWVHKN